MVSLSTRINHDTSAKRWRYKRGKLSHLQALCLAQQRTAQVALHQQGR